MSPLLKTLLAFHSTQSKSQIPFHGLYTPAQSLALSFYLLIYGLAFQHSLIRSLCFSHIGLLAISHTTLKPWTISLYDISTGCFFCLDCPCQSSVWLNSSPLSGLSSNDISSMTLSMTIVCNVTSPPLYIITPFSISFIQFFHLPLSAYKFHEGSSTEPST